jgi:hypothetical protein
VVIASKLYCIPTGPLSSTKRGASRSQRFRRLFGVLLSIASAAEAGRCQASLPTHPLCFNRFPDPFGDDRFFNGDRRRPLACILPEWRTLLDRALLRYESPRVPRPPVRSQRPFADSARPSSPAGTRRRFLASTAALFGPTIFARQTPQRVVVVMVDGFGLEYLEQSTVPVLGRWRQAGIFRRVKDTMPSLRPVRIERTLDPHLLGYEGRLSGPSQGGSRVWQS